MQFTKGNLLEADTEALVNTVNTVGVMGKGIALMFKEAYPVNFEMYERACQSNDIEPGRMFVTEPGSFFRPKWIVNFPTKKHWRHPSKLEWISSGLDDLAKVIANKHIQSIAIPALGAGNGGLDWNQVRPLIEQKLGHLWAVRFVVYEPI